MERILCGGIICIQAWLQSSAIVAALSGADGDLFVLCPDAVTFDKCKVVVFDISLFMSQKLYNISGSLIPEREAKPQSFCVYERDWYL